MPLSMKSFEEIVPPEVTSLILESINEAYSDYYVNISDYSKAICGPTSKANFINDHMVYHARKKLFGNQFVSYIKRHGRIHLLICGLYELKFKKLNSVRRPSSILTQAVLNFNDQNWIPPQQIVFPNMLSEITNLIAGYQQNKSKTGIEAVYIVCPDGKSNRWEKKLGFYEKPVENIASLPTPEKPVKTVKPKRGVKKDDTTIQQQGGILQPRDADTRQTSSGN
jgi:hypothetical protein